MSIHRDYNEPWLSMSEDLLTEDGRIIVSSDPDLNIETMKKLYITEKDIIPDQYMYLMRSHNRRDVVRNCFYENAACGLTHVSLCIMDNLDATLAEVVTRYSEERRVPFIVGAALILDLERVDGLYYYKRDSGHARVRWIPRKVTTESPEIKGAHNASEKQLEQMRSKVKGRNTTETPKLAKKSKAGRVAPV